MALSLSTALRNARLDAITAAVGSAGVCRIYTGTRPASVATAVGAQVLLAELTLGSPMAPAASGGVLTLDAITQDSAANATGTGAWFRISSSGGTAVIDGDVAASGADLNLNTVSIVSGGPVAISSFTLTEGGA
jgi:hypothetical protein